MTYPWEDDYELRCNRHLDLLRLKQAAYLEGGTPMAEEDDAELLALIGASSGSSRVRMPQPTQSWACRMERDMALRLLEWAESRERRMTRFRRWRIQTWNGIWLSLFERHRLLAAALGASLTG